MNPYQPHTLHGNMQHSNMYNQTAKPSNQVLMFQNPVYPDQLPNQTNESNQHLQWQAVTQSEARHQTYQNINQMPQNQYRSHNQENIAQQYNGQNSQPIGNVPHQSALPNVAVVTPTVGYGMSELIMDEHHPGFNQLNNTRNQLNTSTNQYHLPYNNQVQNDPSNTSKFPDPYYNANNENPVFPYVTQSLMKQQNDNSQTKNNSNINNYVVTSKPSQSQETQPVNYNQQYSYQSNSFGPSMPESNMHTSNYNQSSHPPISAANMAYLGHAINPSEQPHARHTPTGEQQAIYTKSYQIDQKQLINKQFAPQLITSQGNVSSVSSDVRHVPIHSNEIHHQPTPISYHYNNTPYASQQDKTFSSNHVEKRSNSFQSNSNPYHDGQNIGQPVPPSVASSNQTYPVSRILSTAPTEQFPIRPGTANTAPASCPNQPPITNPALHSRTYIPNQNIHSHQSYQRVDTQPGSNRLTINQTVQGQGHLQQDHMKEIPNNQLHSQDRSQYNNVVMSSSMQQPQHSSYSPAVAMQPNQPQNLQPIQTHKRKVYSKQNSENEKPVRQNSLDHQQQYFQPNPVHQMPLNNRNAYQGYDQYGQTRNVQMTQNVGKQFQQHPSDEQIGAEQHINRQNQTANQHYQDERFQPRIQHTFSTDENISQNRPALHSFEPARSQFPPDFQHNMYPSLSRELQDMRKDTDHSYPMLQRQSSYQEQARPFNLQQAQFELAQQRVMLESMRNMTLNQHGNNANPSHPIVFMSSANSYPGTISVQEGSMPHGVRKQQYPPPDFSSLLSTLRKKPGTTFRKLKVVAEELVVLEEDVLKYQGPPNDKEAEYLGERLTQKLIDLDNVAIVDDETRQLRKSMVIGIQQLLSLVDK